MQQRAWGYVGLLPLMAACSESKPPATSQGLDPDRAPAATVDRFSDDAGTLFLRSASEDLPAPGEAIDFDAPKFVGQGFGPDGQIIRYYHFDVQPAVPSRLAILTRDGEAIPDQLPIREHLPGDPDYSDFVELVHAEVPADYVANSWTSFDTLETADIALEPSGEVQNRPVVPEGSTAEERVDDTPTELERSWHGDEVVYSFQFENNVASAENTLGERRIGLSYIFVTFSVNPGEEGGGPSSGFRTEEDGVQTHNVLETVPGDEAYSPLWKVMLYDNADFDAVEDLESARAATPLGDPNDAPTVNCPVSFVAD